jgi:hypothetical protein
MNESHARRRWLVMKDLNQNLFLEEVIFNLKEPTIVEGIDNVQRGNEVKKGGQSLVSGTKLVGTR